MPESQSQYDVAIIGGGPAGVAAACIAAERGCRVVLVENTPWLGGPIWRATERASVPRAGRRWLKRLESSGASSLLETTAFAVESSRGSHRLYVQRQNGLLVLECRSLVIAAGAQELFLPLPGWTLPNVFGVGGLQLLAKSGWPVQGKRVVVAGSGPLLMAVAATLRRRGAQVTDMLEQTPLSRLAQFAVTLPRLAPVKLAQAIGYQSRLVGVPYRTGCWPIAAHGEYKLQSVTFTNGNRTWTRRCDFLACGFALVPSLQWPRLIGCRVAEGAVEVDLWQQTSVPGVYAAGEVTGIGGVEQALVEGQIAGHAAGGGNDEADVARLIRVRDRSKRFAAALQATFQLREELKHLADDDTIICRCEDVRWGQLKDHDSLRAAKLQTRCGMGSCQGRVCHSALRALKGWPADSVRPPLLSVRIGTLSGTATRQSSERSQTR